MTLTSCLYKILQREDGNFRLVHHLQSNAQLSPYHSRFLKMISTVDALMHIESAICPSFSDKQHMVCILLDLEKAYDTAWRYEILKQLHHFGLCGRVPKFIKGLIDRTFPVRVGTFYPPSIDSEEFHRGRSSVSPSLPRP